MEFVMEKFMSLSQEGTVDEYCDEFKFLFDRVKVFEEIYEFYAIYLFICGLEPEIRKIFARWHQYSCTKVKDVISLALKIDSNGLQDSFSPFDPNSSFYNKDLEFDINITLEELMKGNEWFKNGKIQETCDNMVQENDVISENKYDNKVASMVFDEMPDSFRNVIQETIDEDSYCSDDSKENEKDKENNQVHIGLCNDLHETSSSEINHDLGDDLRLAGQDIDINQDEIYEAYSCGDNLDIGVPFVVSEITSMTGVSYSLNNSSGQLRDDLSIKFYENSHRIIEDDLGFIHFFGTNKTHKNSALNQDIAGSNKIESQQEISNSSVPIFSYSIKKMSSASRIVEDLKGSGRVVNISQIGHGTIKDDIEFFNATETHEKDAQSQAIKRSVMFKLVNWEEVVSVKWDMRSDNEMLFNWSSSNKTVINKIKVRKKGYEKLYYRDIPRFGCSPDLLTKEVEYTLKVMDKMCNKFRSEMNKFELVRVEKFEWKPGWKYVLKMSYLLKEAWFLSFIWFFLTHSITSPKGSCLKAFKGCTTCIFIAQIITRGAQFVPFCVDSSLNPRIVKATRGSHVVMKLCHDPNDANKKDACQKEKESLLKGHELENTYKIFELLMELHKAFMQEHSLVAVVFD